MAQRRGPASLGQTVREVLRQHDLEGRAREHAAISRWEEVVGEANARHSQPERVVEGVLMVRASDSSWAQVLQMMKPQILERLAAVVGNGVIRDVRFGAVRQRKPLPEEPEMLVAPLAGPRREDLEAIALSKQERERERALRTQAADPELGRVLARGYASLTRMRRFREAQGWRRCPRCGRPQWGPGRWCVLCVGSGGG